MQIQATLTPVSKTRVNVRFDVFKIASLVRRLLCRCTSYLPDCCVIPLKVSIFAQMEASCAFMASYPHPVTLTETYLWGRNTFSKEAPFPGQGRDYYAA